jgi:hypothetical protein
MIDRLGWSAGFAFNSYGVHVGVRVNDAAVLPRLIDRVPPGSKPIDSEIVDQLYSVVIGGDSSSTPIKRYHIAYWGPQRVARSLDLDTVLDSFESNLQITVAEWSPLFIFVHAGVVEWKGKAILIPGLSCSGKTTLVKRLVEAGARYYSDEYALLDTRGWVHPYPRPLGLRSKDSGRTEKICAEDLGGVTGTAPIRVSLIVMTRFEAGAIWRPRRVSAGKGVLELLSHTVNARRRPNMVLKTLPKVVADGILLKGIRGEANKTADAILDRVSGTMCAD